MRPQDKQIQMDSEKTCVNCGAPMRPTKADLVFEYDDLIITVKDVPVSYCDACGEQYVPGPIGLDISAAVDRVIRDARRDRDAGSHFIARGRSERGAPGRRQSASLIESDGRKWAVTDRSMSPTPRRGASERSPPTHASYIR